METGRRVLLHVGTPKTGTSYLQDVLFHNRESLARQGFHYPADRFDAHFLAALDLMNLPWGGIEDEAIGTWSRLVEQVQAIPSGTVVISHEILATASWQQAKKALDDLAGSEIHVFLSVRDLVRQIPAEWQENVKHRAIVTYAEFLEEIRDPERSTRIGSWFWGVQELPDILDRWTQDIPPERVHLITVPPPGSDSGLLWERFSTAFGLDGLSLDLDVDRSNPSLGVPEAALLREINVEVVPKVLPADYRPLVRELLAHQTLAKRRTSPRLALPPETRAWVDELSSSWVKELDSRGYDVTGSLDELLGAPASSKPYADPDDADPRQIADAAVAAIGALLEETVRLQQSERTLQEELNRARSEATRAVDLMPKRRTLLGLERRGWGRAILRVYRFLRGR